MRMSLRKLKSVIKLGAGGAIVFGGYNVYNGDYETYSRFIMPAIHKLWNAEHSHILAVKAARHGLVPNIKDDHQETQRLLKTKVFGIELENPVGLAAGFDKDGEAIDGLSNFGFGFIEVGSTTPEPQKGNPYPRVFRLLEDRAIINRYGFNSLGHDEMYKNLERQAEAIKKKNIVVGVNLGKNKTQEDAASDYIKGLDKFYSLDVVKYFVINISSPNTPNLRSMQNRNELTSLLERVLEKKLALEKQHGCMKPLLLKIAPDLTQEEIQDIATVVNKFSTINKKTSSVDGLIISNTTISRPETLKSSPEVFTEMGGLSGPPVRDMSVEVIKKMHKLTKLPIIGVGGIETGLEAYKKIAAGASAVQLYSSMAYFGPPIVREVKKELAMILLYKKMNSVQEAIGCSDK